jgi:predicted enzyme related to lactoylglutathione lyase
MSVRFSHVNIIAKDWRGLADFYIRVFGCEKILPERHLEGMWLSRLTAISDVKIEGIHLRLPGSSQSGPTLEIFSYNQNESGENPRLNQTGLAHLAFEVGDVKDTVNLLCENGGNKIGEIVQKKYPDSRVLTVAYCRDPEGNIVEIQNWRD